MQKNTHSGKFIVFEGLDGSGQSTQAAKLADFLSGDRKVHLTKEPTSNLIGGLIRGQLTHDWKTKQECLQLLFAADRAHHLEKEIIPLLKKGIWVVCDRYFFSTIAYGSAEIFDWNWLKEINKHFSMPDISFFLKASPKVCIERIKKKRYELELFEREEMLAKVWQGYERLAKEFDNIYIVDGEKTVEEVFGDIIDKLVCEKLISCK